MNWSASIRWCHRWLGIVLAAAIAANFIAMAVGTQPAWVVYAPLPPLFLSLFSGLYMFALPHVRRGRGAAQAPLSANR